ncbi:Rho GTPase-activating protein 12 [Clarias magur]|uniref:Rho GTPase-activating protein 12 n=1 Tax=Clarias magur TaxID=1594786 RepID=A0A8J4WZD8_CLAMG|nr:Rho GTPase-activating protein 12 [Clarias magur]
MTKVVSDRAITQPRSLKTPARDTGSECQAQTPGERALCTRREGWHARCYTNRTARVDVLSPACWSSAVSSL